MLWNAGIFIWSVRTVVNALRVYAPEINSIFENLLPYYGTEKEQDLINEEFPKCESISVDYAILEKSDEIYCMPASFGWSDLGTWGSLRENVKRDSLGNAIIGDNVQVYETHGCVIHCSEERRVVVQGLQDCIVAEKDNTLLICKLSEEQRIKQFSEE
jgi:mannose-1-phosphate guanylyltransferase